MEMTFAMIKPNAVKSGLMGRMLAVSTLNTWKSRSSRNSKPT